MTLRAIPAALPRSIVRVSNHPASATIVQLLAGAIIISLLAQGFR